MTTDPTTDALTAIHTSQAETTLIKLLLVRIHLRSAAHIAPELVPWLLTDLDQLTNELADAELETRNSPCASCAARPAGSGTRPHHYHPPTDDDIADYITRWLSSHDPLTDEDTL